MNAKRLRLRLAGVVFLLVPALLVGVSVAVYEKEFSDDVTVTLLTGSTGNEMHRGAEVKMRGVVIGSVRSIRAEGDGARLTLAIRPGELHRVPADVTAQMLPTTLFGQRFVALVPPADPSAGRSLKAGDTIPQDRSRNAIELEQVLDHLLPLLTAVKPEKLSATLTAVSQALEGRGEKLGTTLTTLDAHLRRLNPQLPALNRDIARLVEVSELYADAAPDVVRALSDFATTSSTLAGERASLEALQTTTTGTARQLTAFLRRNREQLIRLADVSRPTLELLARHSPAFPCTLRTLAGFVPAMDKALGKGTDRPGLHVDLHPVRSLGAYRYPKDLPRHPAGGRGPRCYSAPYTSLPAPAVRSAPGLGLPNSPQEARLVNELMAPGLGTTPDELPDWSTVLTGPLYRGTEVRLK
ncbi:MCE family protein [Streptomyces clavuligerus]|uniref:Secreted protein n=1 Tax=Streptomyces clavuligerus TaxID=1901 RepID=B5H0E1_STRCL|nr:MCE family protein [Streptomyces clavuligerus]ANW17274.1 ABC transporter substrate-binding protein [Streptomyces clavuligerus]AXU11817.1 MCE family protein [Streptomyces clavuligerus]EDY52037.1 secreted protein [Streptomyces clavuligerus]EFG10256.1 Secreted protein [Streptomyces clavuligerus]MBY6301656.1 MCE family protein [Streptomyces clavuligerus]